MKTKITILIENKVKRLPYGAIGKHGLSMLIEIENSFKILYDTGPNWESLIYNASLLGKNIKDVEMIVISHGHHDHGNDIVPILDYIGKKEIPVVIHPLAFNRKGDIKMNSTENDLRDMKAKLILKYEPFMLYDGIWFSGSIPRKEGNPIHPVRDESNGSIIDEVMDDTALYLKGKEGGIILTGCGHSGILNIIDHAKEILEIKNIYAIVGGFHGIDQLQEELLKTVHLISREEVSILAPCHCSGPLTYLLSRYPGFIDIGVGSELSFDII
ncbi:MAG: MBL fold metallo-hydrolase [Synergistetes bacterium]|nr:MBL fold metallo-hydrolase [Synergistota bacterium]MCX8128450.1 MBL fold metallo-hydrolase [Synergistota bacterium]MDW8193129.1 MBL fold metallo-hydrolase [Synergistota bacterium]